MTPSTAPPDPPAPWAVPQGWPAKCQESDGNRGGAGEFSLAPPPQPPLAAGNTWGEGSSGPNNTTATIQKGASYQTVSNGDKAYQTQTIVNTDYGYRIPYYEGAAQFERAQISLIDQQFAQFMYGQNLPHLAQVFQNELNSIDSNVFRLQVAFLDTILLSPIAGTVTGIYKNPGDAVKAGEPVIRVEDNSNIYLVATVDTPRTHRRRAPTTNAASSKFYRDGHDTFVWCVGTAYHADWKRRLRTGSPR